MRVVYTIGSDPSGRSQFSLGADRAAKKHYDFAPFHHSIKGDKVGNLPIEFPTRIELVINL